MRLRENHAKDFVNPAIEIARGAAVRLIVFVVVLVALFALKQEFDNPQIFTPSNMSSTSTK